MNDFLDFILEKPNNLYIYLFLIESIDPLSEIGKAARFTGWALPLNLPSLAWMTRVIDIFMVSEANKTK